MFGLRRRRLPSHRRPVLAPDERILAWAVVTAPELRGSQAHSSPRGVAAGPELRGSQAHGDAGDDVVVATTFGLWLPDTPDRLGWHEIHKATWSGRQLTIVPAREVDRTDGYAVMADLPPIVHQLLDPNDVPDQVRTRVSRSVAYTAHHQLPDGGGLRVVARRVSGVNGLRWTVRYDPGTDPAAPGVPEATAELVARARVASDPSDG